MSFSKIKHVFFDLDHTLWDFDKNSAFAFETIFKKHQLEIPLNQFLEIYIPRNQHYWKLYQINKISHEDLRFYRLHDVFEALQIPVSKELIELLSEEYINYLTTFNHLFDGAIEILDYLKPKYQLHIITNGFDFVQTKKLKNSNIEHYFSTITNSEMAGEKKPHSSIFNFALSLAKATPQESIMIGDSLEADIEGALNVGMQAVYFNISEEQIKFDFPQINHLSEIKNYL